MKKILVFVCLCTLLSTTTFAQTYYYERVATVTNGLKSSDSGDGHFITFTSKGCYDSNNEGFDEKFGFREYIKMSNGIQSYYGDSYFGKAYYYFTDDFSRLNIKQESSNKIFVYVKKTAPVGMSKSSRKLQSTDTDIVPIVPITVPIQTNIYTPSYDDPQSTEQSSKSRYGYYTCHMCHGSGKCPTCNGTHLADNYYTGDCRICTSCNNKGQCSYCNGTGKRYGVVR